MKPEDLVFVIVFLTTLVTGLRAGVLAIRGRKADARRVASRGGAFTLAYLVLVVGTSLLTPRHWIDVGQEQRFDDWALTVLGLEHVGQHYTVRVRVANRGRGRAQRAADAEVVLIAADRRRFPPNPSPSERSLQSRLQPGESFETVREFDVPSDADVIGLDVIHGAWPQLFIIGDRGSLFFKRPLVRTPSPSSGTTPGA